MSHAHHNHTHSYKDVKDRNLLISIFLNVLITAAQIVGGLVSGSLALLSDALHNFSDVISLIVSFVASKLSKQKASINRTFGYKRAEILAAFVNAATLVVVAVLLIIEAVKRFQEPQEIASNLVIWLALIAILANGFSVLLLKKDFKSNINIRSAYLHLLTDYVGKCGCFDMWTAHEILSNILGGQFINLFNCFIFNLRRLRFVENIYQDVDAFYTRPYQY